MEHPFFGIQTHNVNMYIFKSNPKYICMEIKKFEMGDQGCEWYNVKSII